jgi:WD40 repeat protein
VNCLTWDQFSPNQLISTSYDGTSRIFDLERQEHRLLYGDEGRRKRYCTPGYILMEKGKFCPLVSSRVSSIRIIILVLLNPNPDPTQDLMQNRKKN